MTAIASFGDYELDVDQFELRQRGQPVPMEPQVFEVLAYLVANRDRIVLKDEIIGHIWPDRFISEAALNSRVMAARKAVGDNGKDQRLIRTIRGRGFRFVGDVTVNDAAGPSRSPVFATYEPEGALPEQAALFGLDVAATSFVGREHELARLEDMLSRPACRLITIVGPGGVGKTRLAAEFARRVGNNGREVVSIALQEVTSAQELIAVIAGALGLRLASIDPRQVGINLGERNVLLLLDNFEHLAASAAGVLPAMLLHAPGLSLVVTSREVLGLREEWIFPVTGLGLDEGDDSLDEAVQLFLDRELQAGAHIHDDSGTAVRTICRLVDGMPLALELAASLRRYLSREQIAERLEQTISILQADVRNLPLRHRSVPGLIDESVGRLTADQRTGLLALSVFDGPFSSEAGAAVAGASLSLLGELVDRSLVQPRHGRFALHPLLRQYARDRLGFELEVLRRAHAEYFITLLAGYLDALERSDQVTASAAIDSEFPNILAAWRWASENRRLDLLDRSAYPLVLHAHVRSRFAEIRDAVERAVEVAERSGEDAWRVCASLLMVQTWTLIRTSRGPEVVEVLSRAEELYRRHEEPPPPGLGRDPTAIRAMVFWANGRYHRVVATAAEAEELARSRGDVLGEAFALWLKAVGLGRTIAVIWHRRPDRGGTYSPANDDSRAAIQQTGEFLDRAAGLLNARGESWFLSTILIERLVPAKALGDVRLARALTARARAYREQFGDLRGVADALIHDADTCVDEADPDCALEVLERAEPIVRRLGDLSLLSEWQRARSHIDWLRGNHEAALNRLADCAELSIQIGSVNNIVATLRGMGDVYFDQHQYELAAELFSFVIGHPATMPFSRARAETALAEAAAHLPAGAVERIGERMRHAHLPVYTAEMVARIRA